MVDCLNTAGPLVSVIIPTYNRSQFLLEAVDSALGQGYPALEIIVVDDGSTDNSRELLDSYISKGSIRYFWQENRGQSVARNHGLSVCKGDFICFLDSDNRWLPGKIVKSLKVFDEFPEVDIVYADCLTIDVSGRNVQARNMRRYSGRITPYLFRDNCVSMNTSMVRRRCFDEMGWLEAGRRVADDYELWLRFSVRYVFQYVPDFFAEYRVMENQISSDSRRRFESNEEILRGFQEKYPGVMSAVDFRKGWSFFFTRKGRRFASRGEFGVALSSYGKALLAWPLHSPPWRALLKLLIFRR